uniref:Uncharacterized protein n=1 Tax=Oryza nivara TaxID=4536 RepID=A0A0E0I8R6_ORYNI
MGDSLDPIARAVNAGQRPASNSDGDKRRVAADDGRGSGDGRWRSNSGGIGGIAVAIGISEEERHGKEVHLINNILFQLLHLAEKNCSMIQSDGQQEDSSLQSPCPVSTSNNLYETICPNPFCRQHKNIFNAIFSTEKTPYLIGYHKVADI